MANSSSAISRDRANELLAEASALLVQHRDLRLGQAIVNCMLPEENIEPWPDLFFEECPAKATELFYARVEDNGKRKLTGKLDLSFMTKGK